MIMAKIPDLLCRDCDYWVQVTNIMGNKPYFGYCMKCNDRKLLRYVGSSCIVDEDGNYI